MKRALISVALLALVSCRPTSEPPDDADVATGQRPTITTKWFGSRSRPALDAGLVDAGVVYFPPVPPRQIAVRVVPATYAGHPIVEALKALFNDADAEQRRAHRDFIAAPLEARYRAIDAMCHTIIDEEERTGREHRLADLCEWDRTTCGNGSGAAHEIIIERVDATTATAVVVKEMNDKVRVQLQLLDRWRITDVECGRDRALAASGILESLPVDAGVDAGFAP